MKVIEKDLNHFIENYMVFFMNEVKMIMQLLIIVNIFKC